MKSAALPLVLISLLLQDSLPMPGDARVPLQGGEKPPHRRSAIPIAPPPTRTAEGPSHAPTLRRNQVIRVGLTTDRRRITISCPGKYRVIEPGGGKPIWKEAYRAPLTIGVRGAPSTEGRIFRAQIGSFASREAADSLSARLRADLNEPVVVAWLPDRRAWRIRVGAAETREALSDVVSRLRAAGYADAWIADEPIAQTGGARLVLLDEEYAVHAVKGREVEVEPSSAGELLAVDGKEYRGALEVRLDVSGGIRVVNVVPMESYLRGVVPAELGPAVYPELEALKAQALAARTYAYRNLGQFADEGFDVCDTPRCQVYGGVKAEHPLSDRAVLETDGEIVTFHGEPINAMYTSTCGGHTEDASEIFPEDTAPYLVGVPCAPEEGSRKTRRIAINGSDALTAAPAQAAEAAALLTVHGLVGRSALDAAALQAPIPAPEAASLIDSVGSACGIGEATGGGGVAGGPEPSIAALASRLVDRLAWGSRIDLLIAREEAQNWLHEESSAAPDENAAAVAYFLRQGCWPENARGAPDPGRRAARGDLARLLLCVARSCDLLSLNDGIVRGGDAEGLKLSGKGGSVTRSVGEGALLFADFGAGPVPVSRLGLVPGDKVRYHSVGDRIDELLLLPGRQGFSDDRYSSLSAWEVAYTPDDLAKQLDAYLGSGNHLLDVVPVRRGISGRVTELKIVGSKGEARVMGFHIRTALGLKDTLFALDRQRDRAGTLRRVVFTGRGWGHGLGMCQVGAYGMALRGISYRSILAHYYSGISVERLP